MTRSVVVAFLLILTSYSAVQAGVKSKAAREAAEYLFERFGKEVGEETVETLTEKIGRYAARYGDEAVDAIRRAGPRAFKLLDDAGENAPEVVRLLNRYGNDAVWVASKPRNLAIFVKYGDEAAEAMIKHPGIAGPAIERFGQPAARAIRSVSSQNARRIAMMADDGSLAAAGKADELLEVIGKYGDRAADFIWKHKGALAVATVAVAFLRDPEPFIDGIKDIAEVAVRPIDLAAKEVGRGIAEGTDWTFVIVSISTLLILLVVLRMWKPWKHLRRKTGEPQSSTNTTSPAAADGASNKASLPPDVAHRG